MSFQDLAFVTIIISYVVQFLIMLYKEFKK